VLGGGDLQMCIYNTLNCNKGYWQRACLNIKHKHQTENSNTPIRIATGDKTHSHEMKKSRAMTF
jgi:hypothetical protein